MNQRLTLTDIATLLAQRENITPQQAEEFIRAFFELTEEGLEQDSFVKVTGFGTTKLVEVSERESVNVNTGERIQIGSHSKVSFTPDNRLRDLVNRPFDHFTTVTLYDETSEEELETANFTDSSNGVEVSPRPLNKEEINSELLSPEKEGQEIAVEIEEDITESQCSEAVATTNDFEVSSPFYKEKEKQADEEPSSEDETIVVSPSLVLSDKSVEIPVHEETITPEPQLSEPNLSSQQEEQPPSFPTSNVTNIQGSIVVKTEEKEINKIGFWKTAFFITLSLLLCSIAYFLGYQHGFNSSYSQAARNSLLHSTPLAVLPTSSIKAKPKTQRSPNPSTSTIHSSSKENSSPKRSEKSVEHITSSQPTEPQKGAQSSPPISPNYLAEARKYQQLPKGTALIVGTLRTHTLQKGDNIYRLARQTYGSNDFAPYIILYNHILDPDIIPLNQEIRLPKLVHAKTMQLVVQ